MLKIGVFGTGHLGKFHLNNWKEVAGAEVVGFYDPSDEAAAAVSATYGLRRYTRPEELIQASDAVDIVTPTDSHFELCKAAIRAGRHVFVEKPMVASMQEAQDLVKLVKESGIKLQVGHVERFNPAYLAMQGEELNPMFIEVHRLAQYNPRGTEVSVIMDLMIHDIDIVLSLVKSDVKTISASGVAVLTDTPDIANVRIEFDNGCVANLTSSRISMKRMRKIRLFQRDAYIALDLLDKKTEVIRLGQEGETEGFSFDIETPKGPKRVVIANPQVPETNAIKEELSQFVQAINSNSRTVVNEIDGLRAMEVAHHILQKINNNLSLQ